VRRTADDRLVVHHDPVRHLGGADLASHIPTLDAALDACEGMFVNIEIKNDPDEPDFDRSDWVAHRMCGLLTARGQGRRWLISSFRYETVAACRVVAPWLRTAWLTDDCTQASIDRTAAGHHDAIHPQVSSIDEQAVRAAHAAGLAVNVWTCDDPRTLRQMMAWGVDGICTNVPDVAVEVRRSVALDR
jgi:glycerophosphoryl diester phosphodiesterase